MKIYAKSIATSCIFVFMLATHAQADEGVPSLTERQSQMWVRSCAFCHIDGNAGAPIIGIQAQWATAREKSESTLLRSVIEGINDMPPLGYCMACEEDDFRALITFMMSGANE